MPMPRQIAILGPTGLFLGIDRGSGAATKESAAERRCTGQSRASPDTRLTACALPIKFERKAPARQVNGRAKALLAKGRLAAAVAEARTAVALDPAYPKTAEAHKRHEGHRAPSRLQRRS